MRDIWLEQLTGQNLVKRRRLAGMTQQELADRAGVSAMTVHNWEKGRCKPQSAKLRAIKHAFRGYPAAPPVGDRINRAALSADIDHLREGMGILHALVPNLLEALARVAQHTDKEARDIVKEMDKRERNSEQADD